MIKGDLAKMMKSHARQGRVDAIFLRPVRREPCRSVQLAIVTESGLEGDHARAGKRALTLIQAEHLPVIAELLGRTDIAAADLRRNIVVSGLNVLALRHQNIQVGDTMLRVHGPCPPCSRMEEVFGPGGYSAVRGHGGVYCEVLEAGSISVGDTVSIVD